MHSLIGKINKDQQFGKDPDFRAFYSNGNNNSNSRCDSGMSHDSADSSSTSPAQDKTIVDLDLVVEKWIGYMWDKTKTKQTNKCEFEDLEIIVNWDKVELIQEDAKFETGNSVAKAPVAQTLFRTHFTNKTDKEQEYSFKTERTTRQSCGFSFTKGFSREKEGGITFKLPQDIVEIGGGIRSEQSIECGKDQTKEESVTWAVDSMIKVQPHSKTSANLVITELTMERSFSVNTYLKGRLYVTLNNRKDNNSFVKSFVGDLVEIISLAIDKYWLPYNSSLFEIIDNNNGKFVKSTFKGRCAFRLGVEQHVTLNESKISH